MEMNVMDGHTETHGERTRTSSRISGKDHANRISGVAEIFGMSERHIWRLIKSGDLRAERLSVRCIRIFDSEIARYRGCLQNQAA